MDRFVRLRDRRCRFPGCRTRIRTCDLDHRIPYPHGRTTHDNLEGLCEHHHRLSHQAPGWRLGGSSDGGLVWTLPGGTTITTVPPRFGTDDGTTAHPRPNNDTDHTDNAGHTGDARRTGHRADSRTDWRHLTPHQRRERIHALLRGRHTRTGDDPAPF